MADIELLDSPDGLVLVARGDLTIGDARLFKERLMEAFDGSGPLNLELDKVDEVDLSCIQLLCSANRSYLSRGRGISFTKPLSGQIRTFVRDCALDPAVCGSQCRDQCLWK